jgi:flavin reductase (DIM6/NTAB) family NADH-FMN oxidoreductase RutF
MLTGAVSVHGHGLVSHHQRHLIRQGDCQQIQGRQSGHQPGTNPGLTTDFTDKESAFPIRVIRAAPSSAVAPPRIAEAPASLECAEWGTLLIGSNRVVIGLIKRVHLRDALFDPEKQRVRADQLALIGRMAAPHWYCRTRDRFEMIRPK